MRVFSALSGKFALLCVFTLLASIPASSQLKLRRALDYDGDNKADFTIFRAANPDLSPSNTWFINKSGGGFTVTNFGLASQDFMTPGDYDGDGKGDISVWRDTDGTWYRFNSQSQTFFGQTFGLTGDEPVARDYDGDGKTDLAVVRRTGGLMIWYVARSSDGGFSADQWGLSTDFTAPGDYDGDGKFDLTVQRPGSTATSQSVFYSRRSLDGGVTTTSWGLSNDLVVPGDYDGDSKTDIAVVREGSTPTSSLVWYILSSQTGAPIIEFFGLTGSDLNAQNDYDGDGKCDIAIWRDTDGTFYYKKSSDGGYLAFQWGAPNDYPVASYDTH